jgi:hypothetical protein
MMKVVRMSISVQDGDLWMFLNLVKKRRRSRRSRRRRRRRRSG